MAHILQVLRQLLGSKYNFRLRLYTDDTQTDVGLARVGGVTGT